jgi:hypothetical protein
MIENSGVAASLRPDFSKAMHSMATPLLAHHVLAESPQYPKLHPMAENFPLWVRLKGVIAPSRLQFPRHRVRRSVADPLLLLRPGIGCFVV